MFSHFPAKTEDMASASGLPVCACPIPQRRFMPHWRELMVLVCPNCGGRKKKTLKSVPHYNRIRRRARLELSLLSATAQLDTASTALVERIRTTAGITSNTSHAHVTLVEGLSTPVPPRELRNLHDALVACPGAVVIGAHCVKTRTKGSMLVVLQLALQSPQLAAAAAVLADHPTCRLPQWPLHIALGTAHTTTARDTAAHLAASYRGTFLHLATDRMALLGARNHDVGAAARQHSSTFTLPLILPDPRMRSA